MRTFFALMLVIVSACSSASGAPVTATGSVGETTLDARDGAAQHLFGGGVAIAIVDFGGACSGMQANGNALNLLVDPGDGNTLGPATFDLKSLHAAAAFTRLDDACVPSESGAATGGTITIDAVSSSSIRGSYDVTFRDGAIHGTFDVPFCGTSSNDSGHPICKS